MLHPHGHHPLKHPVRHYIVLATLVIGGIFLLLLMNDNPGQFSLTSAVVGVAGGDSEGDLSEDGFFSIEGDEGVTETTRTLSGNEVNVKLSFDQIPSINKETKIDEMTLRFTDLTTKININDDKLELNNIDEVDMVLTDFFGEINFDDLGISLDGTAKKIEVNNIALASSKEDLKISLDGLDYTGLTFNEIDLKELELETGNGILEVTEKLSYTIEDEKLKIHTYLGSLELIKEDETSLNLEGYTKGINIDGEGLTLQLN